jgi:hypothetical protein
MGDKGVFPTSFVKDHISIKDKHHLYRYIAQKAFIKRNKVL